MFETDENITKNEDFNYDEIAGYRFNNPELLKEALTHSSYGWNDSDDVRIDNEKLEFLGDAFLDAIIGSEIFRKMSKENKEGDLTKVRAQVVCERSLAVIARNLGLGNFLRLGVGEEKTGGREKDSLIADAVEAIIGAIYLDGGFQEAEKFVLKTFDNLIDEALAGKIILDHKTALHEYVQKEGASIKYVVDKTEGPDHDKTFYLHIEINDIPYTEGVGKSKKEAQQDAAKKLVEKGLDNVF